MQRIKNKFNFPNKIVFLFKLNKGNKTFSIYLLNIVCIKICNKYGSSEKIKIYTVLHLEIIKHVNIIIKY